MSEYQCYQFERLEGHLSKDEREELSEISSRANITSTGFSVHYNYSDLRADITELMLDYFDIGYYYSDWGDISVYIRLPPGSINQEWGYIEYGESLNLIDSRRGQLLIFSALENETYLTSEDLEPFFDDLPGLRTSLLKGDYRLFYLSWLKETLYEPDLPHIPLFRFDFLTLSAAQQVFVELFDIPLSHIRALELLLADNPAHICVSPEEDSDSQIAKLTEDDKARILKKLFDSGAVNMTFVKALNKSPQAEEQIAIRHWLSPEALKPYSRQAKEQILEEQAIAEAERIKQEKAHKAQRMDEVYTQRERIWQQADHEASLGSGWSYDRAFQLLNELAEAHKTKNNSEGFLQNFRPFMTKHGNRPALIKRFKRLPIK